MLPNYQARSPFVLKHTTSYRASEAERDTIRGGMQNRVYNEFPESFPVRLGASRGFA